MVARPGPGLGERAPPCQGPGRSLCAPAEQAGAGEAGRQPSVSITSCRSSAPESGQGAGPRSPGWSGCRRPRAAMRGPGGAVRKARAGRARGWRAAPFCAVWSFDIVIGVIMRGSLRGAATKVPSMWEVSRRPGRRCPVARCGCAGRMGVGSLPGSGRVRRGGTALACFARPGDRGRRGRERLRRGADWWPKPCPAGPAAGRS